MSEIISYLYSFFTWNINSSLKASILVILILSIRAAFREKINARFQYTIWFLLIFRLLIPITYESSFSINNIVPVLDEKSSIISVNTIDNIDSISYQNNIMGDESDKSKSNFKSEHMKVNNNKYIINNAYNLFFIYGW